MNSYVFATPDGSPINFLIRVQADDEDEALSILKEYLWSTEYAGGKTVCSFDILAGDSGIVDMDIYIEPDRLTVENIQEIEDGIDQESGEESGETQPG